MVLETARAEVEISRARGPGPGNTAREASRAGSRHARWYGEHHVAARARSALRVWAFRNRGADAVDVARSVAFVRLPRLFGPGFEPHLAPSETSRRKERTHELERLEMCLVVGRSEEACREAEGITSQFVRSRNLDLDDLVDLGRALDILRDGGTSVAAPRELRGAFERQVQISRWLDTYWYHLWSLDRRRLAPYLVKSFLNHASLWRVYGFLTDGSIEYRRAEELVRHAIQVLDASDARSSDDETLAFFRFVSLLWYARIRGVHQRIYDREVLVCIDEMGEVARDLGRGDVLGQWARDLSGHAVTAAWEWPRRFGDPIERAREAESHLREYLSLFPQLQGSLLRVKLEACAHSGRKALLEEALGGAALLIEHHRDTAWARVLERAAALVVGRICAGGAAGAPSSHRLAPALPEIYLELLGGPTKAMRRHLAAA